MATDRIRVQRFRQMHKREEVELYLGAVDAEELVRRSKIDVFEHGSQNGYQRKLEASRVRPISRYVTDGEGMLPTAILVNVRSSAKFEPDTDASNFGALIFDEHEPWWIVDGQHRTEGIKTAIERLATARKPTQLNYELPVTFCLGFDQADEMDLFQIVNSKAKGVPTDLVAELVYSKTMAERGKDQPARLLVRDLRKAAGVAVAHYLDVTPGPWQGRMQAANEPKDTSRRPMQVNTVASTLLPALRERWVDARFLKDPKDPNFEQLSKIVLTFWKALAELMPDAFADVAHYAVQRPIGVYSFHELLPDVMDYCRLNSDWSVAAFKGQLATLEEWVESPTWHRDTGEDIVKANNRASINSVVSRMRALYRIETPNLPE